MVSSQIILGAGWGGRETTHPAVVSPAHDNTMTCDTVGKILMEFLVAPALTNGNSMQGLAVTDAKVRARNLMKTWSIIRVSTSLRPRIHPPKNDLTTPIKS